MKEWLLSPAFDWCANVPWWAAVLISFGLGALLGILLRSVRTEAKLARHAAEGRSATP